MTTLKIDRSVIEYTNGRQVITDSCCHSRFIGLLQEDGDVSLDVGISQDPVDARPTIRILVEHRFDELDQLSAVELRH